MLNADTGTKEGIVQNMLVQDDLHVFDITTSTWLKVNAKGTPPSPRYAHSATCVGKRVIIFGGFNGSSYLDDVFVFDTGNIHNIDWFLKNFQVTTTWHNITPKGKLPVARYAHSSTLTFSSTGSAKLLVFGGCGESSVFNELIVLDLGNFYFL